MRQILLAVVAFTAIFLSATEPGSAYSGSAPWCAVVTVGRGASVERCIYRSFEECQPNVIAGDRGFCNTNPYWAAAQVAPAPKPRVRRKHRH